MSIRWNPLVLGCALLVAAPAHADWSAKAELGGSVATGNSENQSANAALALKHRFDSWTNEYGFTGNYGNDGSDTTAQRWELRAESMYDFTPKAFWFGAARYENDRFSAYDYQASIATGLGYKFIDTEETRLRMQVGPGYRYSRQRDTGRTVDGMIARGNLLLEQRLTSNTKVVERFLVESGSANTYLQNNLGLEVKMTGTLGLRIGYEVRYNSDVEPGIEHTDTLTTIGLLYESK
jgi:putative salt-induced outer membrane protein